MNRKKRYGLVLVFILSFNISFILFNINIQPELIATPNSNGSLSTSGINVTNSGNLNLSVNDTSNHSISWTLTDETSSDYLGVYSFTADADGSDPAGLTVYEEPNTNLEVIADLDGHSKVVELWDDSSSDDCYMYYNFPAQVTGTVEFWIYGIAGTASFATIRLFPNDAPLVNTAGLYLKVDWTYEELQYHDSSYHDIIASPGFTEGVWHHIRFDFDCDTDTYDIWVDGTPEGSGLPFSIAASSVKSMDIATSSAGTYGNVYTYIDAIDYSWAPGYYQNRNMDVGPVDYLGAYSFTEDAEGTVPAGWGAIEDHALTTVQVVESFNGHHKVVEMYDNYAAAVGMVRLYTTIGPQISGTVEWWSYGVDGAGTNNLFNFYLKDGGQSAGTAAILLQYDLHNSTLRTYNGTWNDITVFSTDQWFHTRLQFDCTTDTFLIWQQGEFKGNFTFSNPVTDIDTLVPDTGNIPSGGHYVYFDAIDYSWAPGYYLNRNMNCTPSNLSYAVFENDLQKSSWQQWSDQVQVDYNVSGQNLGFGVHNISLVYNDGDSNWYHDDVMVTVTSGDTNKPNILSVTQNPTIPAYQENINITTRITEDSQVQTVYLESNHTGTFWNYSMTLLSGTLQDGVWNSTLVNWPANRSIAYRIYAIDNSGNTNSSSQSSFGYFDVDEPNIVSVTQVPPAPSYQEAVNISAHITDVTEILTVYIETNYTGTLVSYPMSFASGTLQEGIWEYSFSSYPLNNLITYQIYATDVLGNTNTTTLLSFGVFDTIDPTIVSVTQNPENLSKVEPVDVTVRIVENLELTSVVIESNHTGSWGNYSMTLLNGTLQDGFWNYTIANWVLNQSNSYRIIATDVAGRTATTTYSTFGYFPIIQLTIISDAVDFDISGNRKCDVSIRLNNTGNTIWTNINVTIEVPVGWSADLHMRTLSQLAPGEYVIITYKLTAPETYEAEDLAMMTINITAEILETGQSWTDSLTFYVVGIDPGLPIWIWIIIIVGSAAAATTSFVVVRKRGSATPIGKGKSFESLKWTISKSFPKEYSVLSMDLMERINSIQGLTADELPIVIQYLNQLDEEEAKAWLDEFQDLQPD